ncbi:uncharacterized protein N7487_004150 [Penicillium crustosum]|uniref:uncharacterized protein n=1 Tax=Penicillium crustosum TaxID=36656 RepID=UPI0023823C75|nr:uncharacterized protein N7487_004150 [Penicillium crustosum]KAJ5409791.1 hypothetical protein N7487_004150 [Penicillium crustosum]
MTGIGVIMAGIEIITENYRRQLSQSQSKKILSKKKIADPHGMITDLEEKQYITLFQTRRVNPKQHSVVDQTADAANDLIFLHSFNCNLDC